MEIELIEVNPGQWAYRVGGIYQEFDPDLDGQVPMDKETAMQKALIIKARLEQ